MIYNGQAKKYKMTNNDLQWQNEKVQMTNNDLQWPSEKVQND
jgi:hypothetical protein